MAQLPECPTVDVIARELIARLPGGANVQIAYPGDPPSPLALVQQMMAQASAAMAPLSPAFTTINTVTAVIEFCKSVVTLNPVEIAEALQTLIDAAAEMASLAPPLSVPAMVVSMLDILLTMLDGMVTELQSIIDYQARIADAQAILDSLPQGNAAIEAAISCANVQIEWKQQNLDESLSSAGGFVDLINLFMSLIGLDPISGLGELDEDSADAIDTLSDLINTIRTIREAIPL